MRRNMKHIFVVGFAIFAMFFGAGNLIFPPFLGMKAGTNWWLGFAGFVLTDVIFSIIVLLVITKRGKGAQGIVGILGDKLSKLFLLAITICIGPLVAIPRTAATTYELSVQPIFPKISSPLCAVIFFTLVFVLCVRPARILDMIGTVLSPVLLITLGVLIIKGIASPLGTVIQGASVKSVAYTGITTGYQTMDAMGGVVLSFVILGTLKHYQLTSRKEEGNLMKYACLIAGISLILVYGGLAYLGATVSGSYPADISRSQLMLNLAQDLLGKPGMLVLGIIVAAACLTTAIGLVSSSAGYMEELTQGKIPYQYHVLAICIISAVICNFGLTTIISFAAPILNVLYPILMTLVLLALIPDEIITRGSRLGAVGGTVFFVCLQVLETIPKAGNLTSSFPLEDWGFGWILPAFAGLVLGEILSRTLLKRKGSAKDWGFHHPTPYFK